MRKVTSLLLLSFIAAACGRGGDEMSRYHEDGRAKPAVAVASMLDTTSFDGPWSLSEEITSMVVKNLSQSGTLFVKAKEDFSFTENPFASNLSWIKAQFPPSQEFAVFLELVKHETIPEIKGKNPVAPQELSHNLNMAVRLRLIDLRGSAPKIVLQEMIKDSYYIPKTFLPTDYNQVVWGSEEYPKTPMGIAHSHLAEAIASRLADYILLAKSR